MRLVMYDLFIWINFMAIPVVLWNSKMHKRLNWLFWTTMICFGGIGCWIGLFFLHYREKEKYRTIALILGILQVLLLHDLIDDFLFVHF